MFAWSRMEYADKLKLVRQSEVLTQEYIRQSEQATEDYLERRGY